MYKFYYDVLEFDLTTMSNEEIEKAKKENKIFEFDKINTKISDLLGYNISQIKEELDKADKIVKLHIEKYLGPKVQGKCSICGADIINMVENSHDAWPVRKETWGGDEDRCCSRCDEYIITPMRRYLCINGIKDRIDTTEHTEIGNIDGKEYKFQDMTYDDFESMLAVNYNDYYSYRHPRFSNTNQISKEQKKKLEKQGFVFI